MAELCCRHCGNDKPGEVGIYNVHIGGQGYVGRHYCHNVSECWRSWERRSGREIRKALEAIGDIGSPSRVSSY